METRRGKNRIKREDISISFFFYHCGKILGKSNLRKGERNGKREGRSLEGRERGNK